MTSRKTKTSSSHDNLDDLFSGIGTQDPSKPGRATPKPTTKAPPPGAAAAAAATAAATAKPATDKDILADLESQLASDPPTSRPHTPRVGTLGPSKRHTAALAAEDKRRSTDSARSARASFTPSATSSDLPDVEKRAAPDHQKSAPTPSAPDADSGAGAGASGGGWWGGILSTATAAMKQAEAAYKEVQQNEEAKKWAHQVRGFKGLDIGALRNYGDDLRHRAIPAFTNILNTIAPPISSHERLMVHITHDLVGYPSLDPLIQDVFARVMSQVEGGDLLVVQRGQESASRRPRESSAGWRDGPWWRQVDSPRELGIVRGLADGTKLCRASAEAFADEYFAANGGVEHARARATQDMSESNPVRTSDIFLAIQVIETDDDGTLFARSPSAGKNKEVAGKTGDEGGVDDNDDDNSQVVFAVFILDPAHQIEYATVSQSMPSKWAHWLETSVPLTPASGDDEQAAAAAAAAAAAGADSSIPEEIREIIDSGAVDPREWVAEWTEEMLSLAVGTVAQRYVARRMGVGEGRSLGRARRKMEELVNDNAGEAARAGVI